MFAVVQTILIILSKMEQNDKFHPSGSFVGGGTKKLQKFHQWNIVQPLILAVQEVYDNFDTRYNIFM